MKTISLLKKRAELPLQTTIRSKNKETIQSSQLLSFSLFQKYGNAKESAKVSSYFSQSQNTFVPGMTEEYITQVSEEVESRVTQKLSQEFIRTESRILAALSKLDEYLLNPQVKKCSGTVTGTYQNNDFENREPTGDRSQNDTYPEVELCVRQASNLADSDQEETSHSVHILEPKRSSGNERMWVVLVRWILVGKTNTNAYQEACAILKVLLKMQRITRSEKITILTTVSNK